MNADTFDRYAEYRQRGEDPGCSALRVRLGDDASEYEAAYQRSQEGRAVTWAAPPSQTSRTAIAPTAAPRNPRRALSGARRAA